MGLIDILAGMSPIAPRKGSASYEALHPEGWIKAEPGKNSQERTLRLSRTLIKPTIIVPMNSLHLSSDWDHVWTNKERHLAHLQQEYRGSDTPVAIQTVRIYSDARIEVMLRDPDEQIPQKFFWMVGRSMLRYYPNMAEVDLRIPPELPEGQFNGEIIRRSGPELPPGPAPAI